MENLTHYPALVFALAFVSLSLASAASAWLRRRNSSMNEEQKDDLSLILAASLTLLALIIGFSFSMATNRYDQRKNFEEAEANAIGTEILRADLLPPADASTVPDFYVLPEQREALLDQLKRYAETAKCRNPFSVMLLQHRPLR